MFISVVIPTYNRRPILEKCLYALEKQSLSSCIEEYEVVVVDDGSTDGTPLWLKEQANTFQHVRLVEQEHAGPSEGRNKGVEKALGDVIVFIDSDLVVTENFLSSHAKTLVRSWKDFDNRFCFTYGAVINTANFDEPTGDAEPQSEPKEE